MKCNVTTKSWAVGTEIFTLSVARSQWWMPVDFADITQINFDEITSFLGVSQLPDYSSVDFKKDGDGWAFVTKQHSNPLLVGLNPQLNDFSQGGLMLVPSLQKLSTT